MFECQVRKGNVMQAIVKAFLAIALIAGFSYSASAQVAKSTGHPGQQPAGTVIVGAPGQSTQPTQSTPSSQPAQTSVPAQYPAPAQSSAPVYSGSTDARVQQIDARLQQIKQERDRLRQEEQALRQERAQRTGQASAYNAGTGRHDNGKHLGWYKNGKANGAKGKGHGKGQNDD
jgi:type IV secretory pathway VirB10-like protein